MTQPNQPFAAFLQGAGAVSVPAEPTEALPQILQHRPSQAKRNRDWEREQNRVTYRGIPEQLNEDLKALALELNVPIGDVVRAFLEFGLAAYREQRLTLDPQFAIGKKTLFPRR